MNIKNSVKYLLPIVVGGGLLVYTCKDFAFHNFLERGLQVNKKWVLLAVLMHLFNHFLRAYRWRLLISAQGKLPSLKNTWLAEMAGFFTNVPFPRAGEWTRCQALKKLEGIKISHSLGAVIAERTLDVLLFAALVVWSLVCCSDKGVAWVPDIPRRVSTFFSLHNVVASVAVVGMVVILGVVFFRMVIVRHYSGYSHHTKGAYNFLTSTLESVKITLKATSLLVWLLSLLIWSSYFLVEYLSFFAVQELVGLSLANSLQVFITINLGVAIPVPSNIGTYHFLVSRALTSFGIAEKPALFYATLTHALQLFNALVIGGLCSLWVVTRKKRQELRKE